MCPPQLPIPTQGFLKQQHKDGQGAEPAPNCEGDKAPRTQQLSAQQRTEGARDTRSRATREAELTEKRERVGIRNEGSGVGDLAQR